MIKALHRLVGKLVGAGCVREAMRLKMKISKAASRTEAKKGINFDINDAQGLLKVPRGTSDVL